MNADIVGKLDVGSKIYYENYFMKLIFNLNIENNYIRIQVWEGFNGINLI